MTVWERICSHLNFFFGGGGLILVFLVLFCLKLKKKKSWHWLGWTKGRATVSHGSGASYLMWMELLGVAQSTTWMWWCWTRYRLSEGNGRFLPAVGPAELRETECPLVVENRVDDRRSRAQNLQNRQNEGHWDEMGRHEDEPLLYLEGTLTKERKIIPKLLFGESRVAPRKQRETEDKYCPEFGSQG